MREENAMTDRELQSEVQQLTQRVKLAEEVIRQVEDDALPPAAIAAWERYRARYPREDR
jgi:hypothetical protein